MLTKAAFRLLDNQRLYLSIREQAEFTLVIVPQEIDLQTTETYDRASLERRRNSKRHE